jgi:GntR family transcriptional repressor for pyruvate dehydrogenase complex
VTATRAATTTGGDRIARPSLVDVLEERLRSGIVDGTYPPGGLLPPERELADRYGVTRTTVKHTLVRLAQVGLIVTRHGVGSEVCDWRRTGGTELLPLLTGAVGGDTAGTSASVLADVVEARGLIGADMAGLAASRTDRAAAERLRTLLDAVATAPDAAACQDADLELHRELARTSGNSVFVFMTNTLFAAYEPWRRRVVDAYAEPAAVATLLQPVVDAVCDGDVTAARAAAAAHLDASGRLLAEALSPSRTPPSCTPRKERTR